MREMLGVTALIYGHGMGEKVALLTDARFLGATRGRLLNGWEPGYSGPPRHEETAMVGGLRVTLLGGFEARLASGATARLPAKKAQALLAYLVMRPGQSHPATSSRPCCGERRATTRHAMASATSWRPSARCCAATDPRSCGSTGRPSRWTPSGWRST